MLQISKPVEHVPSFLLQLNYMPERTFILSDIPLDLEDTYRIEKNSIYNRKKLITDIQNQSLSLENLVLLSSAENESFMVDFVDDLRTIQSDILITYIPNVIQPLSNRNMYYRILHVYTSSRGSTAQSLDVVAINKCYSQISYNALLSSQPEFLGKKIIGFTEEDVLDFYDVMDMNYLKVVI